MGIQINYINTKKIRTPILFNKNNFKFNIEITDISNDLLGDEECAEFLDKFRFYNGLYDIDGTLYSKEKAVIHIKEKYYKPKYSFILKVSFKKDDILYINFKD